jgi:hypothetical protein
LPVSDLSTATVYLEATIEPEKSAVGEMNAIHFICCPFQATPRVTRSPQTSHGHATPP